MGNQCRHNDGFPQDRLGRDFQGVQITPLPHCTGDEIESQTELTGVVWYISDEAEMENSFVDWFAKSFLCVCVCV